MMTEQTSRTTHIPFLPGVFLSPRRPLADLSDAELVRVLLQELSDRESMAAVRTEVNALLSMGPTLTAAVDTGTAELVERAIENAQKLINTQAAVLAQPLLTSRQVSQATGAPGAAGHRSTASRLRGRGDLIGIEIQGRYLFPAFQFDLEHARLHPVVVEVNHVLDALADPWRAAVWWLTAQGRTRPVAMIGRNDKRLLKIAADSVNTPT
jgi:hypothetical protein